MGSGTIVLGRPRTTDSTSSIVNIQQDAKLTDKELADAGAALEQYVRSRDKALSEEQQQDILSYKSQFEVFYTYLMRELKAPDSVVNAENMTKILLKQANSAESAELCKLSLDQIYPALFALELTFEQRILSQKNVSISPPSFWERGFFKRRTDGMYLKASQIEELGALKKVCLALFTAAYDQSDKSAKEMQYAWVNSLRLPHFNHAAYQILHKQETGTAQKLYSLYNEEHARATGISICLQNME